jgi:hypothetical protein
VSNDLSKAVIRAASDQAYRAKLINDPMAALDDEGVVLPDGIDVKGVENDAAIVYLVLPEASDDDLGLTGDELQRVAAGITETQLAALMKASGARH